MRAYHWAMSKICPEFLGPETSSRSLTADVLVREEPEDEEGEQDEEDDNEENEDDGENDGYSE